MSAFGALRASAALLLVAAALLQTREAGAHAVGLSRGQYRATPAGLDAELSFAPGELEPGAQRPLAESIRVTDASGAVCTGSLTDAGVSDPSGVTLALRFACPGPPRALHVELAFWDHVSPGHRHVTGSQVLQREQPGFDLPGVAAEAQAPPAPGLRGWIALGIEHILLGYDHLTFLLALVLVASNLRRLAACVSVFTLAHSVTLALATLDLWAPPGWMVESSIALSICYVGIENLTARATRPRYSLVFGFGLIHGFGFAGALRELGVAAAQTPLALFGFNLGVELGQLGLLALAFPLVLDLRNRDWFQRRGVPVLSAGIAVAGAIWFISRVHGA